MYLFGWFLANKYLLLGMLFSFVVFGGFYGWSFYIGNRTVGSATIVGRYGFETADFSFVSESVVSKEVSKAEEAAMEKLDPNRKLVPVEPGLSDDVVREKVEALGGRLVDISGGIAVIEMGDENAKVLSQEKGFGEAEVDHPVFMTADKIDWGVERVGAPKVWSVTKGAGVKVAVIDSGVDYNHPDLAPVWGGGVDLVNNDSDAYDDNGHGTHVAGTIAASANDVGQMGVAPAVTILGVKALDASGGGYISDLVEGVDWAVKNGARVINLSLASTYDSQILKDKIDQAAANGVVIVAAAGNTGGAMLYPAAYPSVISVGALDTNNNIAAFSALGATVAAPGVMINSTIPGGGYATWAGTSMAAPHVSGVAAMMIANGNTNVRTGLTSTALDLGPVGTDSFYGYGLVQAPEAVGEIDVLAPQITFVSPANNAEVNGVVRIKFVVSDEKGVLDSKLLIDDKIVGTWNGAGEWYMDWDAFLESDGERVLLVRSTDTSGNVGEVKLIVKKISEPIPTASTSTESAVTVGRGQVKERQTIGKGLLKKLMESFSGESESVSEYESDDVVSEVTNEDSRNPKSESVVGIVDDVIDDLPVTGKSEYVNERSENASENRVENGRGKGESRGGVQGDFDVNFWELFLDWWGF